MSPDPGADPARHTLSGQRIGPYQVEELIGSGGMGEVYRAVDLNLEARLGVPRRVAIKRMKQRMLDDPAASRRFLREARIATTLNHPFIATLLDVTEHENTPLIVMEYIDGRRLDRVLKEDRPPPARVREYALEITRALGAIHGAGLVHRDLKPGNVMITADGHVKVMDFGLSGRVTADSQGTTLPESEVSIRGGTPEYMSPEQVRGLPLDARSDLFSLGILLYEALTGAHPFRKATTADTLSSILNDAPSPGKVEKERLQSSALGPLVLRLLDKERDRRFQSAAEVETALRAGTAPAPARTKSAAWWMLGAALLLVAAIGIPLIRQQRPEAEVAVDAVTTPAVVILPLDDGANDDGRSRMVAGLLSTHLGEVAGLRTVAQERVAETALAAEDLPFSGRIAHLVRAFDAPWILTLRLYAEGDEYVGLFELHGDDGEEDRSFTLTREQASALARPAAMRVQELILGNRGEPVQPESLRASVPDEAMLLHQRALESFAALDYARALALVEEALERAPDFLAARVLECRLLVEVGYERRARQKIESTAALLQPLGSGPPGRERLTVELTLAELRGADPVARGLSEELTRRFPGDPALLGRLAGAMWRGGDLEGARAALDRALQLDSLDPRLHLQRASLLAEMSLPEETERALDEAERLFELFRLPAGRGEIAERRAFRDFKQRRFAEAETGYAEAQRHYESEGLPIRALGPRKSRADAQLMQWKLKEAAEGYTQILPLAKRAGHLTLLARTLTSLGATHMRSQRLDEADRVLDEAARLTLELSREPLAYSALVNRATVLNLLNRTAEAGEAARQAIALADALADEPRRCRAELRLITAARREGRLDDAVRLIEELGGRGLPEREARRVALQLAQSRFRIEMDRDSPAAALEAANASLELALRLESDSSETYALALRARALFDLGRGDEARADLSRAEMLLESMGPATEIRSVVHEARISGIAASGDWERVLQATREASGLASPADVVPAMLRLTALLGTGRTDEARALADALLASRWTTVPDRRKVRAQIV